MPSQKCNAWSRVATGYRGRRRAGVLKDQDPDHVRGSTALLRQGSVAPTCTAGGQSSGMGTYRTGAAVLSRWLPVGGAWFLCRSPGSHDLPMPGQVRLQGWSEKAPE